MWTAYTTFHTLCHRKKILIVCQEGINEFQTLCVGLNAVETIKLCQMIPWWLTTMGFDYVDLWSNQVPVWACILPHRLLLRHTSFKISFVCASNAMDQMLFRCIGVFQYFSIICPCGASANAFPTRHITSLIVSKSYALIHGRLFHV